MLTALIQGKLWIFPLLGAFFVQRTIMSFCRTFISNVSVFRWQETETQIDRKLEFMKKLLAKYAPVFLSCCVFLHPIIFPASYQSWQQLWQLYQIWDTPENTFFFFLNIIQSTKHTPWVIMWMKTIFTINVCNYLKLLVSTFDGNFICVVFFIFGLPYFLGFSLFLDHLRERLSII